MGKHKKREKANTDKIKEIWEKLRRCNERYRRLCIENSRYTIVPATYLVFLSENNYDEPCSVLIGSKKANDVLGELSGLAIVGIYCLAKGGITEGRLLEDYEYAREHAQKYDVPLDLVG